MKIAQVGVGGWGRNHTRILSQLDALQCVCDADAQRATEYGDRYNVPHYTSVDAMIQSEEFDAAIICTPTSTHHTVAAQLIQSKKHVMVEKPLTYESAEGQRLAELAGKNKVVLTCGYIERFNPAVTAVKKIVESGECGELIMMEFHRENRMPPHIKDVGIIHDTAVHDIDTAVWIYGKPPEVVFARAGSIRHEYEDFASIMLGFGDDRVAMISSNWITPGRIRRFSTVMTEAIIHSDFITQETRIERSGGIDIPRRDFEEPLLLEIQNFIGAAGGAAPLVSSEQAVNVTRIAEAALLSSSKGVPMYLNLK